MHTDKHSAAKHQPNLVGTLSTASLYSHIQHLGRCGKRPYQRIFAWSSILSHRIQIRMLAMEIGGVLVGFGHGQESRLAK